MEEIKVLAQSMVPFVFDDGELRADQLRQLELAGIAIVTAPEETGESEGTDAFLVLAAQNVTFHADAETISQWGAVWRKNFLDRAADIFDRLLAAAQTQAQEVANG